MKKAIVPALALAAAGSVALMASPAAASPEVGQAKTANPAMMADGKWYGQHEDKKEQNYGDVCNIYQFFPGFNIASGQVLNDAIDAPIDVVVQVLTLLALAEAGDDPIINSGCP